MISGGTNHAGITGRVEGSESAFSKGVSVNEDSDGSKGSKGSKRMTDTTLYWFRRDLRLHDNPALTFACQSSQALLPVFVHDEKNLQETQWSFPRMGMHRQAFERSTLDGLQASLRARGSGLVECTGHPPKVLSALCRELNTTRIVCEEIAAPEEQDDIRALRAMGIEVQTIWQSTMLSADTLPWSPAQVPDVFTAFRQGVEKRGIRFEACEDDVDALPPLPPLPPLRPVQPLPASLDTTWESASFPYPLTGFGGSEHDALAYLERYFKSDRPARYKATRNGLSGVDYSTKFSPWLASGALSARRIMQCLADFETKHGQNEGSYWIWFELLWRDHFRWLHLKYGRQLYFKHGLMSKHLARGSCGDTVSSERLAGRPRIGNQPQTNKPAKTNRDLPALQQWMTGTTGHPFVDAGMRELSATGYLSNRMRQVVASYLIHDLNVDWRAGAAWFESQLIDYDVYSNQGNWLYIAGVGTDPRGGRRFNPDKQAADYDPSGAYQKQWGTR